MLVLTRQTNQSIMIGDNIELMVVEIRGDKVRLGINAPREVRVHRKEVYEAIQQANIDAAQMGRPDLAELEKILQEGLERTENGEKAGKSGSKG